MFAMMKNIWLILILFFVPACKSSRVNYSGVFEELFLKSKQEHSALIVLAVNGNVLKDEDIKLIRSSKNKSIHICDFFNGANLDANRIFSFQNYPALIFISDGKVQFATDDQEVIAEIKASKFSDRTPSFASSLDYYFESGEDLQLLLNKILELYFEVYDSSEMGGEEIRRWFSGRYLSDYTYVEYLLAMLDRKSGMPDNKNEYLQAVINSSEFISSPIYCPLFHELCVGSQDGSLPMLKLLNWQADMGEIIKGTKTTVPITIYNNGTSSVTIFRPIVSCPCITFSYPETIDPKDTVNILVTVDAIGEPGYFEKEIILSSTAQNSTIIIPVKGTIITPKI